MRIFDEVTDEEIYNPDYEAGIVYEANNPITHTYVVDEEETGHYETIAEYPNGGKDVEWVVDTPEEGHWVHADSRGEFDWPGTMPEDTPKELVIDDVETIGIYHTYTQEELDEIAEQIRIDEEKANQWEWLTDLYGESPTVDGIIADVQSPEGIDGSLDEYALQVDQAIADLWEAIPDEMNKTPTINIARRIAKLVKRGLRKLEDIKEPMRSLVKKVLEEENK